MSSRAFNTILKDSKTMRLSHTYLLVSEDNEYLYQFAKMSAITILNAKEGSNSYSKIIKDIHPDVILVGKDEKLTSEDATNIASDVYIRPYEGDSKVYILFMSDANDEAQNKLLKTIEEPPESSYFILLTTQERKLLQTILSRCKKLELDLLSTETITNMLLKANVNKDYAHIYASCSAGVCSRAYKMAEDKDFTELYENIFKCLYNLNSSRDVLKFASIFSNKNIDKNEFIDLFMIIVRDLMMIKTGNNNLVQSKKDELKLIASGYSLEALRKIIEYCLQFKEDLVYNTSVTASIDHFLLHVVEVKVRCK